MEKYQDILTIIGPPGLIPIVGASVTVLNFNSSTNATIYSSNSTNAPATNPLTTDASGRFSFYAPNGRYTLQMSGTSIQTTVLTDILLEDLSSGLNVTSGALTVDVSAVGRIISQARSTGDGLPNTEDGAAWLRLEYDDPVATTAPRALDLSFYGFGEIIRFRGDGSSTSNARSVLEFWGQDQAPGPTPYRPIMTLVVSAQEHEVHAARNIFDTDSIILSYPPSSTFPSIYTHSSVRFNMGVARLDKVQLNATSFALISGHSLAWSSSAANPGSDTDISLTRQSAGVLAVNGGLFVSSNIGFFNTAVTTQASVSSVISTTGITSNSPFGFSTAALAQSAMDAIRFVQQLAKRYGLSS